MVILGIDPGYAIVGYGAVEYARGGKFRTLGYGAITTKAGVPLQHRLVEIYQDMLTLLIISSPMWPASKSCSSTPM